MQEASSAASGEGPVRTEGQILHGFIKMWLLGKGFGFATCNDGGREIFVHNKALKVQMGAFRAVLPGTPVECKYAMREGKEIADECTAKGGGLLPGFESRIEAGDAMSTSKFVPTGMLSGTVKFMHPHKGFGFIVPNDGTEDVFMHVKEIENGLLLEAGEIVAYNKVINPDHKAKDKYHAVGVISLRTGYKRKGDRSSMLQGMIKMFDPHKGYGFITPDEGGDDVFVHVRNIEYQEPLEAGIKVSYIFSEDNKGKPEASQVEVISFPRGGGGGKGDRYGYGGKGDRYGGGKGDRYGGGKGGGGKGDRYGGGKGDRYGGGKGDGYGGSKGDRYGGGRGDGKGSKGGKGGKANGGGSRSGPSKDSYGGGDYGDDWSSSSSSARGGGDDWWGYPSRDDRYDDSYDSRDGYYPPAKDNSSYYGAKNDDYYAPSSSKRGAPAKSEWWGAGDGAAGTGGGGYGAGAGAGGYGAGAGGGGYGAGAGGGYGDRGAAKRQKPGQNY